MTTTPDALDFIAADVLWYAISHAPDTVLMGRSTAREIATLAAYAISSCPVCGAEPGENINCELCRKMSALEGKP